MDAKEAIASCATIPEQLRDLDPVLFEAVVAELLAGFGWKVSVTPPTRDGGYDILGLTTDPSGLRTSWLVECKRYRADHKVGVEIARQIVGVKTHIGVPNAVLVTTSCVRSANPVFHSPGGPATLG
ncbi:MAG TPA: restriction endonuclease, partial [Phycisphaerales bacterium]|nr:restriction endonuclease [Phycisphaerales bacterium]HMP38213.1 restriction endonuclease [Phycisphaerales bacterium]